MIDIFLSLSLSLSLTLSLSLSHTQFRLILSLHRKELYPKNAWDHIRQLFQDESMSKAWANLSQDSIQLQSHRLKQHEEGFKVPLYASSWEKNPLHI